MENRTGFQRDLLYVINGFDRPSGREIGEELEKYYPERVNRGRLYPNLDDLAEKSLVERSQLDRRTNAYSITEKGKQLLKDQREWENQYVRFE